MRILYVSQYFPPEPGAPAARVSELAREWAQAGHSVTVLTGMPNHPTGVIHDGYRRRVFIEEDYHGVRVVRTWIYAAANRGRVRRSVGYASFAASAVAFGQLFTRRSDVIVATSPQFLCAVAGHLIATLRRTPFVFEVRDLWPESIVAVGALPGDHWLVRGLERVEAHLYRAAEKIVVVTDSFRERLVQRGIDPHKIAVVKNGVDLNRFTPRSRETDLRARLAYGARFVVSYAGTLGMAHALDGVLDVAKSLRDRDDIRFLFVGDGAERERLETRAKTEQLSNVTFLGALPRDAMNEVYATSDVCLVPLRKTALFQTVIPSKIFEILAMSRPLVLSVDGEARSIVEASGGGIFVPPEDVTRMRQAIVTLASDRERCTSMGENGRRYVVEAFDRKRLAKEYLTLLEGVARPTSSRSLRAA
jgi:glycosyltransferase involved in cell wall biosynthesis